MVSLNPLMVDGTGMCGGCRVKIGDKVKFACVDGPDFDGHQVDFDDLMARLRRYADDGEGRRSSAGRRAAAWPIAPGARARPRRRGLTAEPRSATTSPTATNSRDPSA